MAYPQQSRRELGRRGEDLAAQYLAERGYRILARNWRCKLGEIDIIARAPEALAFIEVKTMEGGNDFLPEDHVTSDKQRRLAKLAFWYLNHELHNIDQVYQIDVVSVTVDPITQRATIRHFPNAISDTY